MSNDAIVAEGPADVPAVAVEAAPVAEVVKEDGVPVSADPIAPAVNDDDPDADPNETPRQRKTRERFEKLRDNYHRTVGELDALKRQIGQPKEEAPQPEQVENTEPRREQFDTDADYTRALISHGVKMGLQSLTQEQQQQQAAQAAQATFKASEVEVRKTHPDYDEVVQNATNIVVPNAVIECMMSSPIGAELRYHLATNPEEAERLNSMSPVAAVREIGKLEARLEGKKSVAPVVSKAPAPARAIGTGGGEVITDLDKLSDDEYYRLKRKK